MKKLPLSLLVVITFAGCDKKEAEEDTDATPVPKAVASAAAKPAAPTPQSGNWMWKNDKKATPAGPYVNPLSATPKGHGTPDKYDNPLSGPSGLDRKKK